MDRVLPQDIPTLKNRKVAQISAGSYHNLALAEDGSLLSWGLNNYGQLGRNADKYGKWPGLVSITDHQGGRKLKGKKIAAGTWHSLAIAENNQVYAWGRYRSRGCAFRGRHCLNSQSWLLIFLCRRLHSLLVLLCLVLARQLLYA